MFLLSRIFPVVLLTGTGPSAAPAYYPAYGHETFSPSADSIRFLYLCNTGLQLQENNNNTTPCLLLYTSRMFVRRGNYRAALTLLQHALSDSATAAVNPSLRAFILNNAGNLSLLLGRDAEAAPYFAGALATAPDSCRVKIMHNISGVLDYWSRQPEGIRYLEMMHLPGKGIQTTGRMHLLKGALQLRIGNTEHAIRELREAIDPASPDQDLRMQAEAAVLLADAYLKKKNHHAAAACLNTLLSSSAATSEPAYAGLLIHAGGMFRKMKRYTEAEKTYQHAIRLAGTDGRQAVLAQHLLADMYGETGDFRQAYIYSKKYTSGLQELKNREVAQTRNRIENRYEIARKDRDIYEKQIQINRQKIDLRQKNLWLIAGGASVVILGLTVLALYRQLRYRQTLSRMQAYMAGEEKERSRIARDLHDGIGGMLASLKMHASALPARHAGLKESADYQDTMLLLNETAGEIRNTAHNLMPELLMHHGFEEAMRIFCNDISKRSHISISYHCLNYKEQTDTGMQLSLYRILQELIQNIIKHAHANQVLVHVNFLEHSIDIMVEDNGEGMRSEAHKSGMGLENIRQRCRALNGKMTIESASGTGTSVFIRFNTRKNKSTVNEYFGSHS